MSIPAAQDYAIGTDAALLPNPPSGYLAFGADVIGGVFSKTCVTVGGTDGLVTYLGLSLEQLQDLVAAMFTNTSEITFTYNDPAGTISAALVNASIANARLANMAALTVKGSVAGGSPADLTPAQMTTNFVVPDGATLEINAGTIREKDGGTTNAKLANMGAATVKGSVAGGVPSDLTPAQVTTNFVVPDGATLEINAGTIREKDAGTTNAKLAVMAADTIKVNATSGSASPTDLAITANTFPARSSAGDIVAKAITDAGLALVAAANTAAETALLDLVVAGVTKGLMSPADKTKLDTVSANAAVPSARAINTTAPLTGGGDLSADRTLALTTSPAGQTPVGVTRLLNTTAPITGGGDLSADRTLALTTSPAGQTPVGVTRTITTTAPLTIGGGASADLSADRTLAINAATTALPGSMSATDKKRMSEVYAAVADFGFVGDLITVFDGVMNTGGSSTTLTCATSTPFTSTAVDGGKRITVRGAGAAGAQLTTTIATISSTSVAILTVGCSTSVSAAGTSFGTDNTTAISNMTTLVNTTNAAFPGVKIVFGQSATNAYGFPTQVLFNKPVQIEGIGGSHTCDSGDYTRTGGTRLAWWGTSSDGGTNFKPFFEVTPSGVQALKHIAFRHCWLDCRNGDQNEALYGLKLTSCHGFELDDFFINDSLATGLWLNVGSTPSGDAKDTTRWTISNFCSRQLDNTNPVAMTTPILMTSAVTLTNSPQSLTVAANTLPTSGYFWSATNMGYPVLVRYTGGGGSTTLTGCIISPEDAINAPATVNGGNVVQASPSNGCCIVLDGSTTANACCSVMSMLQLSHGTTWGPEALSYRNCDTIETVQVMINGGNNTNDGAINRIRKPGVRLNGSNTSATLAARNNNFQSGSAGDGGCSHMGVLNTGARMLSMAGPNYWDLYQMPNAEPLPTVEGNSYFDWTNNGGIRQGKSPATLIADQAIAAATLTLLTGSLLQIPPQGFQIGAVLRWTINGTGGAAGTTAGHIFTVRIGTAGTTADAAVLTFTQRGAPTAAASDFVIVLEATIRTLGAAATITGKLLINNVLTATGAAGGFSGLVTDVLAATTATFNSTTAQQFIHVDLITAAAKTATIQQTICEVLNPANP